jgi:exopolysaccharide production protein ExoQ
MNHLTEQRPATIPGMQHFPWLKLLFLATVFFLALHDVHISQKGADGFNPSEEDLIALADTGSVTRRIAILSLGLFGLVSLIRSRGAGLRINGLLGRTILLYLGLAVLSLTWAEDWALTFRRIVVLAILCLAALAIARRCSVREVVLVAFFWSLLYLLIGILVELCLGTFHPVASGYRFAGTQHPNSQGVNCALLLLSGVAAGDIERRSRVMFRACAALGFVFLMLTGSRTAFAAAVVALAVYWAMIYPKTLRIAVPLGVAVVFCLLLAAPGEGLSAAVQDPFMLGRHDANGGSFNGRSDIWGVIGPYIGRHPILGYGYGGFWTERHIGDLTAEQNWPMGSAHSAFLECMLSLGLVGLIAYVFVLLGGMARSFVLYRSTRACGFAFTLAFLILCAGDGFLESIIIDLAVPAFLSMILLTKLAFAREPRYS